MRWSIPLIFLALAACDAPLEEIAPPTDLTYSMDGEPLDVRAQFDPWHYAWFMRFSKRHTRLEEDDLEALEVLIRDRIGPSLCEGNSMKVVNGNVILDDGPPQVRYLPTVGDWRIVATCV